MAKIPKDPREIFPEVIDDYKALFGEDLISIILYGSAVGKDYQPGKSDINFMIVLSDEGIDQIDRAFKINEKWSKRKVSVPLFLSRQYIETSMDVFPIEYLNFKRKYILVYGDDILKQLSFDPKDIRLQCEREIKGKLLLLREAFLESSGKSRKLKMVISQSIKSFLAIFDALLFLKEKEIPEDNRKIIRSTCEEFKLDEDLFQKLIDIKEQKLKPDEMELKEIYKNYMKEIRKLSKIIDELGG
jgi:hypothetical protein